MPTRADSWRPTVTRNVEFYVRTTDVPPKAYALGSNYLSGSDLESSWPGTLACRICGRFMIDLPPIQQPKGGWPDVVVLICDDGIHRPDES